MTDFLARKPHWWFEAFFDDGGDGSGDSGTASSTGDAATAAGIAGQAAAAGYGFGSGIGTGGAPAGTSTDSGNTGFGFGQGTDATGNSVSIGVAPGGQSGGSVGGGADGASNSGGPGQGATGGGGGASTGGSGGGVGGGGHGAAAAAAQALAQLFSNPTNRGMTAAMFGSSLLGLGEGNTLSNLNTLTDPYSHSVTVSPLGPPRAAPSPAISPNLYGLTPGGLAAMANAQNHNLANLLGAGMGGLGYGVGPNGQPAPGMNFGSPALAGVGVANVPGAAVSPGPGPLGIGPSVASGANNTGGPGVGIAGNPATNNMGGPGQGIMGNPANMPSPMASNVSSLGSVMGQSPALASLFGVAPNAGGSPPRYGYSL